MASPYDEDWRSEDEYAWEREARLFGGDPGPRYYGTGSYTRGGSRYEGGYAAFDDRDAPQGYGSFNTAGGYGSTELYGHEGAGLVEFGRLDPAGSYGSTEIYGHARVPTGPKGYRRSDERIREDICERLMEQPHLDSSDVSVEVRSAHVELEGSVPDRRMKHAIEDLAAGCPGVADVSNRVRVSQEAQLERAPSGAPEGARRA